MRYNVEIIVGYVLMMVGVYALIEAVTRLT